MCISGYFIFIILFKYFVDYTFINMDLGKYLVFNIMVFTINQTLVTEGIGETLLRIGYTIVIIWRV